MRLRSCLLTIFLSTSLVFAQTMCPMLDEHVLAALDNCAEMPVGTACYGAGEISIESEADDGTFDADGQTIALSDLDSLTTTNDEDDLSIAVMRLNRDDVRLIMIAYGDAELVNTAPRHIVTVTALQNVNLRQEPSVGTTAIGSLVIRREYTAIGRLADNTWIQVQLEDGRIGWVSAQYLSTQDGFNALDVLTPTTPPYLPMQAIDLNTGDCGGILIIAPAIDEEDIIFAVNGAQLVVDGILHIQSTADEITLTTLAGEASINTFGFETLLGESEFTTIPRAESGTIAGLPSEVESKAENTVIIQTIEILTPSEDTPQIEN